MNSRNRGVVQIAERANGVREAAGAVPATPTMSFP